MHASPAKSEDETIEVEPGDCGCKDKDPDADCGDTPPPDPCKDNDPDTICGEAGAGGSSGGEPLDCDAMPADPACRVD